MKTAWIRKGHRWLGFFIGAQLLLWTLSGAFFAWTNLDEVHGDPLRVEAEPLSLGPGWVSPSAIQLEEPDALLVDLSLTRVGERTFYRLRTADGGVYLADVLSGELRPPLGREEAIALARASFAPDVEPAEIIRLDAESVGAHHEYRGSPLPAWRISFDHGSGTRVYVDERGGQVTKHRNHVWRAFDFLWMLHTMDYRGRDDFNNPLIRAVSAVAIVLALSGYVLWWKTSSRRRRVIS